MKIFDNSIKTLSPIHNDKGYTDGLQVRSFSNSGSSNCKVVIKQEGVEEDIIEIIEESLSNGLNPESYITSIINLSISKTKIFDAEEVYKLTSYELLNSIKTEVTSKLKQSKNSKNTSDYLECTKFKIRLDLLLDLIK